MLTLLDPTLDVVFKLLLIRHQELLGDMIEAVLNLPDHILELEILNPEIPEDAPGDKSVALDLRVRLHNGHLIDLEMQSTVPPGTRARFLYYWAKNFVDSIARGDDYTLLPRCISILWFKIPILRAPRFHSKFLVCDPESDEILSPELEIHVLELPKLQLAPADRQAKLDRWARFLRASTPDEFEQLAREDAIMSVAKNALEEISQDPEARRIARDRETAVLMHRHLINSSREVGREEGRTEGRAEGLHVAVESLCSVIGIELTAERLAQLDGLDVSQLKRVVDVLAAERKWPDDFCGRKGADPPESVRQELA